MQNKTTIFFLGVAHALDHSFLTALPPVLLLIVSDLGLSLGEIGLAATFSYLLFGAGALIGGPLSDKIGEGRVVFLSLGLAGASTLVLFLNGGFLGLFVMLLLSSIWTSFYHPTANSLISKRYREEIGRAMAFHGVCGSIGQVFVPSLAVFLALAAGWRFSFISLGILSMMVSLYFARMRSPEEREPDTKYDGYSVLKRRRFWALVICNIMIGLYFRGTELFLPAYLTRARGLSIELSGLAISLLMALGVLGQFLGGVGGDRIGNEGAGPRIHCRDHRICLSTTGRPSFRTSLPSSVRHGFLCDSADDERLNCRNLVPAGERSSVWNNVLHSIRVRVCIQCDCRAGR